MLMLWYLLGLFEISLFFGATHSLTCYFRDGESSTLDTFECSGSNQCCNSRNGDSCTPEGLCYREGHYWLSGCTDPNYGSGCQQMCSWTRSETFLVKCADGTWCCTDQHDSTNTFWSNQTCCTNGEGETLHSVSNPTLSSRTAIIPQATAQTTPFSDTALDSAHNIVTTTTVAATSKPSFSDSILSNQVPTPSSTPTVSSNSMNPGSTTETQRPGAQRLSPSDSIALGVGLGVGIPTVILAALAYIWPRHHIRGHHHG